jgi:hypothetical protein
MGLKITGNRIIPSGSVTQAKVSSAVFTGSANPVINTITTNGVLESYLAINATGSVRKVNSQIGYQGPQGSLGSQGAQGPNGIIGFSGYDGFWGYQGPQGFTGPQGPTGGVQGSQGPQGFQGSLGPQGPQSYGPPGPQGFSALSGEGAISYGNWGTSVSAYQIPTSEASAIYSDIAKDYTALNPWIQLSKYSTGSMAYDSVYIDTGGLYYVEVACNYNDNNDDDGLRIFTKFVDTTAMNTPIMMMQAAPYVPLDDTDRVFTAKMQGIVNLTGARIYTLRTWCVSTGGSAKYWDSVLISVAPYDQFVQ